MRNDIFLNDIILRSAQEQLKAQNADGSMPAGINGPWGDVDTPVRNTAHWALLFYKAYEISQRHKFLNAALSACNYLLSKKARPHNASFLCFYSQNKSRENGLIGQAWAIEPLIFIGEEVGRKDYLDLAQEVLIKHNYNTRLHLWHDLNIDGTIGKINSTFNQQLWFAVMNLLVAKKTNNAFLLFCARDFFKNINKHLTFLEPGLIRHLIPNYILNSRFYNNLNGIKIYLKGTLPDFIFKLYKKIVNQPNASIIITKLSIGYLTFNLYALSLCYSKAPEENLWKKRWFIKTIIQMLNYAQTAQFVKRTLSNEYAWRYNPVGFELAYAVATFKNFLKIKNFDSTIQLWIEKQIGNHWNVLSGLMDINTDDPITLSARLYEATRLSNIKLCIHNQPFEEI